jgi:hypothetical protein
MTNEKIINKLKELKTSFEELKKQHHLKGSDKFESEREILGRIIDRIYPEKDAKEIKDKLIHKCWVITGNESDEYWQKFYLDKIELSIRMINTILEESDLFGFEDFKPIKEKTETDKGKIDLLRKDLNNLKTEEKIRKNLEIALNEAEFGHELACGIISARVIVDRLEKINGKNDEERLANLVSLNIIDNTESSKFSSKAFLESSRAGRNAVNHQVSWFPNGAESLSLLSSAFRMTEWVSKYEKEKENGKEN